MCTESVWLKTGCCEYGNETPGSAKDEEVRDCQLLNHFSMEIEVTARVNRSSKSCGLAELTYRPLCSRMHFLLSEYILCKFHFVRRRQKLSSEMRSPSCVVHGIDHISMCRKRVLPRKISRRVNNGLQIKYPGSGAADTLTLIGDSFHSLYCTVRQKSWSATIQLHVMFVVGFQYGIIY